MGIRRPVVAGAFYPADPTRLRRSIEESFTHRLGPGGLPGEPTGERTIISVVCPHAGYMYSGPVAAHSYLQLSNEGKPDTVVIIGPNHTGLGGPVSLGGSDAWETPLGSVEIDKDLTSAIFGSSDFIDVDEMAHVREHSVEVQLPFLQHIYGEFKLVPICMGFQDLEISRRLGGVLAEALKDRNALIIASTDLNHMEPQSTAEPKDRGVIERILALDEEALQGWVRDRRVSMCGYGPVSATLVASKKLGATKAEFLAYSTSGDIIGDRSAVVGYTSIKIT
jgi:AmmeMemoRadiSam system protein B